MWENATKNALPGVIKTINIERALARVASLKSKTTIYWNIELMWNTTDSVLSFSFSVIL